MSQLFKVVFKKKTRKHLFLNCHKANNLFFSHKSTLSVPKNNPKYNYRKLVSTLTIKCLINFLIAYL